MKKGGLKQQNGERRTGNNRMEKGGLRKHYSDRKIVIKKKHRKVKNKMSNFLIKSEI